MRRKYIDIKGRKADVPLNIEQVYWFQYKKLIEWQISTGKPLDHLEIMVVFLGEDMDYWRSYKDVLQVEAVAANLYEILLAIQTRPEREALTEIKLNEYEAPVKRKWFEKKPKGPKHNEIEVSDKVYQAPSDLRWCVGGQYQDALTIAKVIHPETELIHRNEAVERLFKIYFYPIVTGEEYSIEAALTWDISHVRYIDVQDFGGFFLVKWKKYLNGTTSSVQKLYLQTMNSQRGMMSWERNTNLKAS